uniref:Uncharacterized protein n=1 Tax=Zea mays TaxID=4577 RepID=C0PHU2_MAIZE|nr:unknown [Zea mays]
MCDETTQQGNYVVARSPQLTSFFPNPLSAGEGIKVAGPETHHRETKSRRENNMIKTLSRKRRDDSPPPQSRKPVRRRTALRTRRRSRPLSVLPAPSSTELCAAARRATISCGGTKASPASSALPPAPAPAWAHLPLRAGSDGIRTGADLAIADAATVSGTGRAADRAGAPTRPRPRPRPRRASSSCPHPPGARQGGRDLPRKGRRARARRARGSHRRRPQRHGSGREGVGGTS